MIKQGFKQFLVCKSKERNLGYNKIGSFLGIKFNSRPSTMNAVFDGKHLSLRYASITLFLLDLPLEDFLDFERITEIHHYSDILNHSRDLNKKLILNTCKQHIFAFVLEHLNTDTLNSTIQIQESIAHIEFINKTFDSLIQNALNNSELNNTTGFLNALQA